MDQVKYDIIIIGGGAAGLSAAMYAGRLNMRTLVIAKEPGGAIILTNVIENWPGFERISGIELAEKLESHARQYDVEIINETVIKLETCSECYNVITDSGSYLAKTLIFATGTRHKELNVKGEQEYKNRGVHVCALCDGVFYKDKTVAVVGGGDSSAKEALLLSEYASKVYLVMRGTTLRAEPVNLDRVKKNPKIKIIPENQVREIAGKDFVTEIILEKPYMSNNRLRVDGVFIDIGRIPLSDLAKELGVKLNSQDEIIIDREAKTNIPGVYAAGDVADTKFKQAITGAGEGVAAAYSAYRYIDSKDFVCPCGDIMNAHEQKIVLTKDN